MGVELKHTEYLDREPVWSRARDVLAGEDAVKARREVYLPKLENQTAADYAAYLGRACFYNASGRTHETLLGMVFRQPGRLVSPAKGTPLGDAMVAFLADVDLLGTAFDAFARWTLGEVLAVGRCGVLVDWGEGLGERAAVVNYTAESIRNWRTEVVDGKPVLTLVVLQEQVTPITEAGGDEFLTTPAERLRVLRLERGEFGERVVVDLWMAREGAEGEPEWFKTSTVVPTRAGRALDRIPFVFFGAEHSRVSAGRLPLANLMSLNLDHYRLDADYKHGLHYTALPTAWVAGMESKEGLSIGSRTAWMLDSKDARVGFLEFTGQGLQSFERAMDRDERLMGVLGSRMLETQKRAYESAQALELRQASEHSALGAMALSVSESLTMVLRWVCWWHGVAARAEDYGPTEVHFELSEDYLPQTMQGAEIKAVVDAWAVGAITKEQLLDALERGEVVLSGKGARGGEGETSNIQH